MKGMNARTVRLAILLVGAGWAVSSTPAWAQTPVAAPPAAPQGQSVLHVTLPPVTVTAQKEPADAATLPVSITAITFDVATAGSPPSISQFAPASPNTHFTEFTARKVSNVRMRGVGASPANPGVTTYIDGVPQFNASSSSVDLLDIAQIEFVRGPQGALFGRNTLGGLVNITSAVPSLGGWTGHVAAPLGSAGAAGLRAGVAGPIVEGRAVLGLSIAYNRRDGYTTNALTGRDVDSRSALAGKAQLFWTPAPAWLVRAIVSGERARDGDYALNDLAALGRDSFNVARDFQGRTSRDVLSGTILARRTGSRTTVTTTTGVLRWKTADVTDFDYSALPLATRDNTERAVQFTQEVRLASSDRPGGGDGGSLTVRWQIGALFFVQRFDQDAANVLAPFVLSPFVSTSVVNRSPSGSLDDVGLGVYGQGTVSVRNRLDLSLGARLDHERKDANLTTSFSPPIAPATSVDAQRSFSDVSPQASAALRVTPRAIVYAAVGRGFKAGGFNPTSPPGSEAYGEEHAWHVEGGIKGSGAGNRLSASAALFSIHWQDLQNNLSDLSSPGRFYISNVGAASSRGVEGEVTARPIADLDVFGALGFTGARFGSGTTSGGIDVSGRKVANTPNYTASAGVQIARSLRPAVHLLGRLELVRTGAFQYDDANTVGQEAYTLVNVRVGVRVKALSIDGWMRNALDRRYVPVAFAYPGLAPSGFLGEPGAPRTFGINAGVAF
jgi:iron complex outermembrane receptor protein